MSSAGHRQKKSKNNQQTQVTSLSRFLCLAFSTCLGISLLSVPLSPSLSLCSFLSVYLRICNSASFDVVISHDYALTPALFLVQTKPVAVNSTVSMIFQGSCEFYSFSFRTLTLLFADPDVEENHRVLCGSGGHFRGEATAYT